MSTMRRRSQTGPRTDTTHDIFVYMTLGRYPDGANENVKRNLRKRSKMFKLKGSELFHVSTTKDKFGNDVQRERLVLTDDAERSKVIAELHVDDKGNHLGREKVLGALSEKYYFVGMNNKVREYLLNCSSCRTRFKLSEGMSDGSTSAISDYDDMDDSDSNVSISEDCKPIKSEWPARSQEALHFWDIVEMNVMGPYDCIDSKHYIIVFLDLFSNWPEAFVVDSVTPAVVTHLTLNLICRFGCMKTLMIRESTNYSKEDLTPLQKTLENAGIDISINQFSSALSDKIWKEIGVNLDQFTTNNSHWPHCLEFALLPHRVSRPERSEYTPAYITYGRELHLPSSMQKGESDNFPTAEPHLSPDDMTALTDKFQMAYSSYGKNIQAWNSCSQPFCIIPSLNSSEPVRQPGKRGRKKKNPIPPPPPPPQDEANSDKEAEEDMPPPATDITPRTGRKRKRNISRITRLINAENDDDEDDPPPDQDLDDKDYAPSSKMVKVNTEQDGESPSPKSSLVMKLTPPTPKKHICNGCGKEFSRSDVLRRHIREMHETHESMINICPECGICIKRKHHLARHIKQVHSKGCECKACGEMFGNKVELKEHISTAHDGYNCEKCNRNYTSKSGLKFHIAQEHEQKYPCPICGKSSGSSSSYNKHLASHTEGSDIKCPHCRYIFPNKDLFMAHRESCRMSRAYTCSHCGKGFPSKNSFQHHEATHFDGKFPCHICGIKFSFSTNLNRHIRTVHLAKTEPEDVKQSDSSPDKASSDQTEVQKSASTGELFEAGEAGGMEECHNNSLNQIVEAIKLQVERRISAGYCGNGDIPTKQSVGTDAMDIAESNTPQKRLVAVGNDQLSRQLTSSEKELDNQAVQQTTPTKSATSLVVQEFPMTGISVESQKRPDVNDANIWIALQDGSTKNTRNIMLGQPTAAYQVDKPQTPVVTNTENASQIQTQVYSDVGKKTILNTFSEPISQIAAATPDSTVPATYRIISDQSLISQLKSTTSSSVPTYRVITTAQTKSAGTVLPHIYTVMTTDPTRMKATSILPSGYVAPTSDQVQLAVQKQPIVIAAGQTQKSVPLTYAVQQPTGTSVQKVPTGIQSDLASHIQKILPEAYSEVPTALLQKVQSGSFGLVTDESSPQAYSVTPTGDTNKNSNIPTFSVVVKDVEGTDQQSATDPPSSEISAAQETDIHAVQNPEISTVQSTDSGTAFSETSADPVQEIVQFSPELTSQVQEVVQYSTVAANPDQMTPSHNRAPDSFPADSDDNSGTTYTVTADSLQTDEQQKDQHTTYATTDTENVENLMQLSESTQTNIAVDSSDVPTDVTSSS